MTPDWSDERAQKFHTDDVSLPRFGFCFWLVKANSQPVDKHYPDLGSYKSSVPNFCARSSDVIPRSVPKCRLLVACFFQAIIFITPYCYLSYSLSLLFSFRVWSEASLSTSHSYVFLSFSIEWCSETYVFALFMRRVRSDGVWSSSLERLTNSYKKKRQIILTNHNYDNFSVQCSAQIRIKRFRRKDLQRISLVLTSRYKIDILWGDWIQTFRYGGGEGGSSIPWDKGSPVSKRFFSALWTSFWSKNNGGTGPPGPSPRSATVYRWAW